MANKYIFLIPALLISITLKAQKILATVNSGSHLIQTTDWSRFNNQVISVEHTDGTNQHFYYGLSRNYNPNAMYVDGIVDDFAQNTAVYVYVVRPYIHVLSAPSVTATVNSGAHLQNTLAWVQFSSSRILVEELDGRNQHIYTTSGNRPYNPNAMYVTGIETDFPQGTPVKVYNLDEGLISQEGKLNFLSLGNTEKLSVNGKIRAKEIKVEASPWPDYVFNSSYKLPDLKETERFIKENKHLPEIPSASKVAKDGVNLGEMNALLLKKIEELTLHLIEQDKRVEEQKNRLDAQQRENEQIKQLLSKLIHK